MQGARQAPFRLSYPAFAGWQRGGGWPDTAYVTQRPPRRRDADSKNYKSGTGERMKGSTDPHSSSAALLAAFGAAVLDINRLARDKTLERFHRTALERLQQLVPFQRAWWGRAALIDGVPVEHSAHLFNLEEHYVEDWKSISHDDITVGLVHARPGTAVAVDMQATAGLRWLGARHGIGELLCVIHVDPITRLSDHVALYRTPGGPPFADQEKLLLGQLSAHLAAAVSANQIRTLVALRESLERQALAMAVCDRYGVLHCAERGFVDLLLGAWPGWTGPQLPEETSPQGYRDARLVIDSRQVGDLYLLTARQPSAIEQLSNREGDVALLFSEGKTYKQIARDLGLAPNTVRHHIRTIYSKLGVNDKASIAHLLHQFPPG